MRARLPGDAIGAARMSLLVTAIALGAGAAAHGLGSHSLGDRIWFATLAVVTAVLAVSTVGDLL